MEIKAIFKKAVYTNPEFGTTIAVYDTKEEGLITVTGTMLPVTRGIFYNLHGDWVVHPKYGRQFRLETYEEIIQNDENGLIHYLSSGVIKGIGPKIAERIVKRYGTETLTILDENIDALLAIKGITVNKLETIRSSYRETRDARDIVLELRKHGITAKQSMAVYRHFREQSMSIIKEKPYMLCHVTGITFPVADAIGEKTEEYERSYERFKACAYYVMYSNENNGLKDIIGNRPSGSLGMDKDDFGKAMLHLLRLKHIDGQFILDNTIRMIKEGNLTYKKIDGKPFIFLSGIYRIEDSLATHVARIALNPDAESIFKINSLIDEAEDYFKVKLSEEQRDAVISAFDYNLSSIIGPPGTGKTTTIMFISYIYQKVYKKEMFFFAPSGKAASRIKETTKYNASTVHSGLSIGTDIINDIYYDAEEIKFEDCMIVVDEMSMLDVRTGYRLFSSLGTNCRVVLCGDDEQLQSVGAGAVLRDMIDSKVIPVTVLKNIYRQAKGGNIYINSHQIRNGRKDLSFGDDFCFTQTDDVKDMEQKMLQAYIQAVDTYGIDNVMLLSPFKEHDAGVNSLNEKIQELLHPTIAGRPEFRYGKSVFKKGDRVMQLKNQEMVVNGDIGTVTEIADVDGELTITVMFPDIIMTYNRENIDELTLAYASTVHKAQGSEAKCVITCVHSMHRIMLKRNVFYTAFTRAKENVQIFGQKQALYAAIENEDKSKRNTALSMLLRLHFGELMPIESV